MLSEKCAYQFSPKCPLSHKLHKSCFHALFAKKKRLKRLACLLIPCFIFFIVIRLSSHTCCSLPHSWWQFGIFSTEKKNDIIMQPKCKTKNSFITVGAVFLIVEFVIIMMMVMMMNIHIHLRNINMFYITILKFYRSFHDLRTVYFFSKRLKELIV